jgi:hypothetical protein
MGCHSGGSPFPLMLGVEFGEGIIASRCLLSRAMQRAGMGAESGNTIQGRLEGATLPAFTRATCLARTQGKG